VPPKVAGVAAGGALKANPRPFGPPPSKEGGFRVESYSGFDDTDKSGAINGYKARN